MEGPSIDRPFIVDIMQNDIEKNSEDIERTWNMMYENQDNVKEIKVLFLSIYVILLRFIFAREKLENIAKT